MQDADGITGMWGPAVTLPAQVEHLRRIVETDGGPAVVSVMTVRVNPRRDPETGVDIDLLAVLAADSEITHRGHTSWVIESHAVTRHGTVVYVVATTGETRPSGGAWQVVVTIHRSGGRDARGNPLPSVDVPDVPALLKPSSTSDPTDWSEDAAAAADLLLPAGTQIASTDQVTVTTAGPLAGRWRVDGLPVPAGDRIKAQIVRPS